MSGCVQNIVIQWFSLDLQFCESQVFDVPGMDLGFISGGFWRPVAHFSLFSEVPERCWNFDGFSMSDVGPERSRHGGRRGRSGE